MMQVHVMSQRVHNTTLLGIEQSGENQRVSLEILLEDE